MKPRERGVKVLKEYGTDNDGGGGSDCLDSTSGADLNPLHFAPL